MNIVKRVSTDKKKVLYSIEWGRAAGERMSTGLFTYARPSGLVEREHNKQALLTYNFTDAQPLAGTNYYRLKVIDKDGGYTYSEIKSVINNNASFSARLYPNPVHNTALLQFKSNKPRQIKIDIVDINDKVVLTAKYAIDGGNVTRNIDIRRLPAGTYLISIKSDWREQAGLKLVKE